MVLLNSVRRRLVVLHLTAVIAVGVTLPLVLDWRVDATARALHERALREQAQQIAQYLHSEPDGHWSLELPSELRELYSRSYDRYGFSVVTASGYVLFSNYQNDLPLFRHDPHSQQPTYFAGDDRQARLFGASVPITSGGATLWLHITEDEAHRDVLIDDIVAEFLPLTILVIIPILLGLVSADLYIVGRALEPLTRASRLAQLISPAHPDLRLPEDGMPLEATPLVRAVNAALDRLAQGILIQREFLADAAHELRTPLAILRAQVENLTGSEVTRALLADIDSMTRIVNQLIDGVEAESLAVKPDECADIRAISAEVAAFMAPVAVVQSKDIALSGDEGPVWVRGSSPALFRAVRNLVENAITHTPTGTTVEILIGREGTITVSDEGAGIPADQRSAMSSSSASGVETASASAALDWVSPLSPVSSGRMAGVSRFATPQSVAPPSSSSFITLPPNRQSQFCRPPIPRAPQ
jgi:signal transduction histidine kinase